MKSEQPERDQEPICIYTKAEPSDYFNVGLALVFLFSVVMSAIYFCDRFVPELKAWVYSPTHCQCLDCEAIRLNNRPRPAPSPMPMVRPNHRPLPPIQPPEI